MEHHKAAENPAAVGADSIETVETEVIEGVTDEETLTDLPAAEEIDR